MPSNSFCREEYESCQRFTDLACCQRLWPTWTPGLRWNPSIPRMYANTNEGVTCGPPNMSTHANLGEPRCRVFSTDRQGRKPSASLLRFMIRLTSPRTLSDPPPPVPDMPLTDGLQPILAIRDLQVARQGCLPIEAGPVTTKHKGKVTCCTLTCSRTRLTSKCCWRQIACAKSGKLRVQLKRGVPCV